MIIAAVFLAASMASGRVNSYAVRRIAYFVPYTCQPERCYATKFQRSTHKPPCRRRRTLLLGPIQGTLPRARRQCRHFVNFPFLRDSICRVIGPGSDPQPSEELGGDDKMRSVIRRAGKWLQRDWMRRVARGNGARRANGDLKLITQLQNAASKVTGGARFSWMRPVKDCYPIKYLKPFSR
jgi:hypothetical protein